MFAMEEQEVNRASFLKKKIKWEYVTVVLYVMTGVFVIIGLTSIVVAIHERSELARMRQEHSKITQDKDSNISILRNEVKTLNEVISTLLQSSSNKSNATRYGIDGKYVLNPAIATPIKSCRVLPKSSPSGYYWVESSSGSSIRVYCDMTRTCGPITGGWMRVTSLDMKNTSSQCPSSLCLDSKLPRTCRICHMNRKLLCHHHTYAVGVPYSKVCGRVIAYQVGSPDGYSPRYSDGLDGVIFTYGYPDANIWTFFATVREQNYIQSTVCPCINPNDSKIPPVPSFFGNNYFCDTAPRQSLGKKYIFYSDDPLWDGAGCEGVNECCSFNNPPWFYRELPAETTEDIQMRVKLDEGNDNEDLAIEKIDIYVY